MIDKTMIRAIDRQVAAAERMADISEMNVECMERIADALETIVRRLPETPLAPGPLGSTGQRRQPKPAAQPDSAPDSPAGG